MTLDEFKEKVGTLEVGGELKIGDDGLLSLYESLSSRFLSSLSFDQLSPLLLRQIPEEVSFRVWRSDPENCFILRRIANASS